MSAQIHVLEAGWKRTEIARSLAAKTEDPFFVFDVGEVAARLRRWRELLPRVEPFYDEINAALETHFPDRAVRVIAEPGRYFAAAAYSLIACVIAKRELPCKGGLKQTMYFINDGVYGSFREKLLVCSETAPSWRRQPLLLEASAEAPLPCSLWGPTLDGADCVRPATLLPPLAPGGWLRFPDMGAYTIPGAGVFNGFPLPKPHAFIDRELWLQLKDLSPFSEDHFDLSALREKISKEPTNKRNEILNVKKN